MNCRIAMLSLLALLGCDSATTQEPAPNEPPARPGVQTPPGNAPKGDEQGQNRPMTDRKPQLHLSGASDDVLAGDDADDAADTLLESLTDGEQTGIRIDAPFAVETDAKVPVIGAFVRVPAEGEAFENEVAVIATHGDALTVEPALRKPKMKGGMKGGKKSRGGDAIRGSSFAFDARARLSAVDFAASARLWVGFGPYLSNGVSVRAGGDAPTAPSDSVSVTLDGPSSAATEPGASVELSGTAPASKPVHVVALGGPDAFVSTTEAAADGTFSVNLLGDNPLPKAPGTWHVYAFSGEHVAGPVTIELTPGSKPW